LPDIDGNLDLANLGFSKPFYDQQFIVEFLIYADKLMTWLVVWNIFLFSPIVGMMIQSDELIFFRGVGIPPTSCDHQFFLEQSTSQTLIPQGGLAMESLRFHRGVLQRGGRGESC
jgi:hypothetical protein